jgi:hypothetical protein
MQDLTLSANSEDGQKQAVSLLESHLGMESHVFMHLGTTSGQGAGFTVSTGAVVTGLVVMAVVSVGAGQTVVDKLRVEVLTWVE